MQLPTIKRANKSAWLNAISQLPNMPARRAAFIPAAKPREIRAMQFVRSVWTAANLEFLEKYYPVMSNTELAARLKKGKTTIRVKAVQLALRKMFGRNKSPSAIYHDVIRRVRAEESDAMIIMALGVTQDEIDQAIRHSERYGV